MNLTSTNLTPAQRAILRTPLHLVLLATVAEQPGALDFTSSAHLFDAYWTRKRQSAVARKASIRFDTVLSTVAQAISDRQRLSVPDTILGSDELAADADILVSEHVLVKDGHQIAFFHESFFDYAFARQWAAQAASLVEFLTSSEQELFRRGQVRQILHHLRERDFDRYLTELDRALQSTDIRFHIKDAALAVVASQLNPTRREFEVISAAAGTDEAFASRAWQALRTYGWFARLSEDGLLSQWLSDADEAVRERALMIIATGVKSQPDRVAALLSEFKTNPEYPAWLRWGTRFADLFASRQLFDLTVESIRAGAFNERDHELWMSAHDLAEHEPTWAVELLTAYFVERPNALALDSSGKVAALSDREHFESEMITAAAAGAPQEFVSSLLPFMLEAMALTTYPDQHGPFFELDRHFSHHFVGMGPSTDADETLLTAMRSAIQSLVHADPIAAKPMLEELASTHLSGAQWLLFQGLVAGGESYADWAIELLHQEPGRLLCGDLSSSAWTTRTLIATLVALIDDDQHQRLEDLVRDFHIRGERPPSFGYYAWTLLTALDPDRLSDLGRRRLQEYQRKFGADGPTAPEGITGGSIGSPVAASAFSRMRDDNWLQAMRRHSRDRSDWSTGRGGSHELSGELRQQTEYDPLRFASLAMRVTSDINPAYTQALLMGFGQKAAPADSQDTVFDAIRHISTLGHEDSDRWLGWALRPYINTIPMDLVELVRDRALAASNPTDDAWSSSTGDREPGGRLRSAGINSARGSLVESLGDMVVTDPDGTRTAAVAPYLDRFASDPVLSVRSQAAHLVAACLTFDREAAIHSFWLLINADDEILTGPYVRRLMMYTGNGGASSDLLPVIERMLASTDADARRCGGEMAAYAALDWSHPDPLSNVLASNDESSRRGVAEFCAHRLPTTQNVALAEQTLSQLFNDPESNVRDATAIVAPVLRGRPLLPFENVLMQLIDSEAFGASTPQLFITLEDAPDRVDALALRCAQRFAEVFRTEAGDIRTGAAGDARYVSALVIRGLAQARETGQRAALLDVVDELMKIGAYGVEEAVDSAAR